MSQLDPTSTTARDVCYAALRECGAFGVGQTPSAENLSDTQARLQWMLQQWERKRWLVYHLVDKSIVSTGAKSYSVGPGADIDTNPPNPFNSQFGPQFGPGTGLSVRSARIESAFLRQLTQGSGLNIDYQLSPLMSREDYNKISIKGLAAFPGYYFYDSAWPNGEIFPWPIPQASIYSLHISIMEQLPPRFLTSSDEFNIPYEYYGAMYLNLALRCRPMFGIRSGPGDELTGLAKDALNVLRGANVQIARLTIPSEPSRNEIYNIFSDRIY